jgi:flagellar assembly factor FliW
MESVENSSCETFIANLRQFYEDEYKNLFLTGFNNFKEKELYLLYNLVIEKGGFYKIKEEEWKHIEEEFGAKGILNYLAYDLKQVYETYLKDYEIENSLRKGNEQLNKLVPFPLVLFGNYKSFKQFDFLIKKTHKKWSIEEFGKRLEFKSREVNEKVQRELLNQPRLTFKDGRNQIRLCLLSKLPTEVNYGLDELVKLSYVCEEDFILNDIPDLLDILMELITEWLWEYYDRQSYDPLYGNYFEKMKTYGSYNNEDATKISTDTKNSISSISSMDIKMIRGEEEEELTYISEKLQTDQTILKKNPYLLNCSQKIGLALRNLAILNPLNCKFILNHSKTRLFVLKGALLQGISDFEEIRQYSIDILHSIAPHYTLKSCEDILIELVIIYLRSQDYFKILAALAILLNLVDNHENDTIFIQLINYKPFWKLLYDLVLILKYNRTIYDLIREILCKLMQMNESLEEHIINLKYPLDLNFEKLNEEEILNNFMSKKPSFYYDKLLSSKKEIFPNYYHHHSLKFEIEITKNWLIQSFEEAVNFLVQYPRMYWAYTESLQNSFSENSDEIKLLEEKEFLNLLEIIFPNVSLQCLVRQGQPEYFISGIRLRQNRV